MASIGVNNYLLTLPQTRQVLQALLRLQTAVLGGDVYLISDGQLICTYDNWYCEPHPHEIMENFAIRSNKVTEEKIKYFTKIHKPADALFALVIASKD